MFLVGVSDVTGSVAEDHVTGHTVYSGFLMDSFMTVTGSGKGKGGFTSSEAAGVDVTTVVSFMAAHVITELMLGAEFLLASADGALESLGAVAFQVMTVDLSPGPESSGTFLALAEEDGIRMSRDGVAVEVSCILELFLASWTLELGIIFRGNIAGPGPGSWRVRAAAASWRGGTGTAALRKRRTGAMTLLRGTALL